MTPETQVKNEVVAYLKASGLFWMRLNSGKVKVRGGIYPSNLSMEDELQLSQLGEFSVKKEQL
jgi:hypothetical protein